MAKKSPIKNLVSSMTGVHRNTLSHLIDSASNAVQQGAQHVVASSLSCFACGLTSRKRAISLTVMISKSDSPVEQRGG